MGNERVWPDGATYVFQGTIAEDATAGTHVCSLTVQPFGGNEMMLLYGSIIEGSTTTAQVAVVQVTDGTNVLAQYRFLTDTAASIEHDFPVATIPAANTNNGVTGSMIMMPISGAMNLVLKVTTAAVSVTQTFAVVCRIRGGKPVSVLNDTIGTSTNTVNTDTVF